MPSYELAPDEIVEFAARILDDRYPRLLRADPAIRIEYLTAVDLTSGGVEVPYKTKLVPADELARPSSPDVRVILNADWWDRMTGWRGRESLMAEALYPIDPEWIGFTDSVRTAAHSRPKIKLKPPDILIRGYAEPASWYGTRSITVRAVEAAHDRLGQMVMDFMKARGDAILDAMTGPAAPSGATMTVIRTPEAEPGPIADVDRFIADGVAEAEAIRAGGAAPGPVIEPDVEKVLAAGSDADDRRARFEAMGLRELSLPETILLRIEMQEVGTLGDLETALDDADFDEIAKAFGLHPIEAGELLDAFYAHRNVYFGYHQTPDWAGAPPRCGKCRVEAAFIDDDPDRDPEWQCSKCFTPLATIGRPRPETAPLEPDYGAIDRDAKVDRPRANKKAYRAEQAALKAPEGKDDGWRSKPIHVLPEKKASVTTQNAVRDLGIKTLGQLDDAVKTLDEQDRFAKRARIKDTVAERLFEALDDFIRSYPSGYADPAQGGRDIPAAHCACGKCNRIRKLGPGSCPECFGVQYGINPDEAAADAPKAKAKAKEEARKRASKGASAQAVANG